ncbi:MAG TPA: hypothetical protein DCS21_10565 [Gammaproteobacteria bacterium]|nr:hypothetical protein [Gammaproteobacteria bacterium]
MKKGGGEAGGILNGQPVSVIYADLTGHAMEAGTETDLTQAKSLLENGGIIVRGSEKGGAFNIVGDLARRWLMLPNPHNRPNSDVLRPWMNAMDITRRPSGMWIIDFGIYADENEAALYQEPFAYLVEHVQCQRSSNREGRTSGNWWLHRRSGEDLRTAISNLKRYICTPRVSKYRLFIWLESSIYPDSATFVIARSDDATFGILHSRFHELWTLRTCTWLGKGNDPRYTPTTCFETFPFPSGLTPNIPASEYADDPRAQAIAEAACRLNELRENWLNPPQWVDRVPEIVPGYPDRIIPKPEHAAELKKRTLTNLYNQRPAWLNHAHHVLDEAVAAAYGWPADLSDEEMLRRLLALNRERAGTPKSDQ